jgi:parvulin-like peptidyl-prolyl isomerase
MSSCHKQEENVVITVGDLVITDSQIRGVLKTKYPGKQNYKDIELDTKKKLLEPLINRNLHINAAYDLGLENDNNFKQKLENQKLRVMSNKYYELMIVDKIIPESEIEKFLVRQGIELMASHILIGFEGTRSSSHRSREEAEKLAEEILNELKAGADFATTAEKYSDDPSVKENKGNLGYFTWGKMVGPFQEATWELEIGEISKPVESMFGFHIIKLEDTREVPNYTPDRSARNKARIKRMLLQSHGDEARDLWVKHWDNLKQKYHYILYDDSIKYVSNLIKEILNAQKILPGSFTTKQKEITLAEYEGGKITLGSLIDVYKDRMVSTFGKFTQTRALKADIERQSRNKLIMIAIKENGIDKLPEIVREIRQFTEDQMNRMVEQKAVTENVDPNDQEVKAYFKRNPDSFKKEAEIEIWEIFTTDRKVAETVAQKAKQGVNFEDLLNKYSEDKSLKNKGGYLGYKKVSERGEVSREAHKLGPGGKIGGPVKFRRGWSVFKTGQMKNEEPMNFEEAKNRAKSLLKRELTLAAKTEWETSLKSKYTVNIDEEKLKEI